MNTDCCEKCNGFDFACKKTNISCECHRTNNWQSQGRCVNCGAKNGHISSANAQNIQEMKDRSYNAGYVEACKKADIWIKEAHQKGFQKGYDAGYETNK